MIQLPDDRRPPLTPQLALRVTILGTFALAMFAIIFFRLWFLQVLSGDKYLAQANVNFARSIDVPAPRGEMLDASGNVLVKSIQSIAVQISPPQLPVPLQLCPASEEIKFGDWTSACSIAHPPQADAALYDSLARVLSLPTRRQECPVNGYGKLRLSQIACSVAQGYVLLSYAKVTVEQDITNNDVLYYLKERAQDFPGVSVEQVWLRQYPYNGLAAQLFGTIGPISCDAPPHVKPNANNCELKDPRFKGLPASSIVGQSGLEWSYNKWLQGVDGSEKVQVNALGAFTGVISQSPPTAGDNLKLSLSMPLQSVGQQALQASIDSNPPANGGAFVAMNPVDGAIYAMGSLPTFNPNVFTKPVPESVYEQLNNASSNYPLLNRAIQSVGPTGSTFKPITATAALESGAWSVDDTFDDTGQFCFSGQCRHNAGMAVDGDLDLVDAIRVSSDDFFYNLGVLTNNPAPKGGPLQYWAHQYGIGRLTGVDIGGEMAGNLPTPKWRSQVDQLELRCEKKHHVPAADYFQPGYTCGIADGRPWSVGDNENLAVGQGDVQVTPLQLAVVYAAIANGGTIVRPHVGLDVQNADGVVLQNIDPSPARHLNIDPFYLDTIREGLREAASVPGGTSADVFGNFPEQVYGKTGTAQYNGQQDYAWYACFVPPTATTKPIVVVVTVEQGGFGAVGAAPVAREILSQWFFGHKGAYVAGSSQTL
jgi:penicillin-binding protein 2